MKIHEKYTLKGCSLTTRTKNGVWAAVYDGEAAKYLDLPINCCPDTLDVRLFKDFPKAQFLKMECVGRKSANELYNWLAAHGGAEISNTVEVDSDFKAGLALRDFFAGQALPQMLIANDVHAAARKSYLVADAMLEARNG